MKKKKIMKKWSRNMRLKRLSVFMLASLMMVGSVSPAMVKAENLKRPAVYVSSTRQSKVTGDAYYELLMKATDSKEVVSYIKEHIKTASESQIDEYMRGLFSFENDVRDIDFTPLKAVKNYLPTDVKNALPFLMKEHQKPSIKNGKVTLSISALLGRAKAYEAYLKKNPSGTGSDAIRSFYEDAVTQAITGGYQKEMGVKNRYVNAKSQVSKKAMSQYENFVKENKTGTTRKVVSDYVNLLKKTDKKITKKVETFYNSLYKKLQK